MPVVNQARIENQEQKKDEHIQEFGESSDLSAYFAERQLKEQKKQQLNKMQLVSSGASSASTVDAQSLPSLSQLTGAGTNTLGNSSIKPDEDIEMLDQTMVAGENYLVDGDPRLMCNTSALRMNREHKIYK